MHKCKYAKTYRKNIFTFISFYNLRCFVSVTILAETKKKKKTFPPMQSKLVGEKTGKIKVGNKSVGLERLQK